MDIFYLFVHLTLASTIALILVALGGLFAERSGVTNIALEGIMIIGAFAGTFAISKFQADGNTSQLDFIIALLISGIVGIVISLLHAYSAISKNADQIISATAINIFAVAFVALVATTLTGSKLIYFSGSKYVIDSVPILGSIPFIGDMFFQGVYITLYIGIAILVLSIVILNKTRFGLRLRACGENPQAADSAGINVIKIRYIGVMISGFLAGIAGTSLVVATAASFSGTVYGYGFLGLAVLISGQWNPIRILIMSLVFGGISTLGDMYTSITFLNNLGVHMAWYKMLPYVVTLVVLAVTSKNSRAPKAAGEPYDPGKR